MKKKNICLFTLLSFALVACVTQPISNSSKFEPSSTSSFTSSTSTDSYDSTTKEETSNLPEESSTKPSSSINDTSSLLISSNDSESSSLPESSSLSESGNPSVELPISSDEPSNSSTIDSSYMDSSEEISSTPESSVEPEPPSSVEEITYELSEINGKNQVKEDDYIQLSSLLTTNGDNTEITWVSLDENIAKVDSSGKVTGIQAGKVTIQVYANGNPSIYKEKEIEVLPLTIMEKYGLHELKYLTDDDENHTFDQNNLGYIYDFEDIPAEDRTGDVALDIAKETKSNMHNGGGFNRFRKGSTITARIQSTLDTSALLSIALCNDNSKVIPISSTDNNGLDAYYGTDIDSLTEITPVSYSRTGVNSSNWSAYKEYVIGEVKLKTGLNYIKFTTGSTAAFNIDYFTLVNPIKVFPIAGNDTNLINHKYEADYSYSVDDEIIKDETTGNYTLNDSISFIQAEDLDHSSDVQQEDQALASNGKCTKYFQKNSTLSLTIDAENDQDVLLRLSGAVSDGRFHALDDMFEIHYGETEEQSNTVNLFDRYFEGQVGWGKFIDFHVGQISLKSGLNYITIKGLASSNLDYIQFVSPTTNL